MRTMPSYRRRVLALAVVAAALWLRRPDSSPEGVVSPVLVANKAAPSAPGAVTYTVVAGDTLSAIAARHGTTVAALLALNELTDPDAITVGQSLLLAATPKGDGPAIRIVPDGELVLGPAYVNFDVAAVATRYGGRLSSYTELVDGESWDGPSIVARIAAEYSVGPRVLMAFVEAASGWVSGRGRPGMEEYPAGLVDPERAGLWRQLSWLADTLNAGYYDWLTRDRRLLTTRDGEYLAGAVEIGPGSFAVQRALAALGSAEELPGHIDAFLAAYEGLFGDPWAPGATAGITSPGAFPPLELPWPEGDTWWLTGGPHGGWGEGSAWAALDFVPDDEDRGCYVSGRWATAVAPGVVLSAGPGALWLDLDGDGLRQTGPAVLYLHLAARERASPGTRVRAGDPLGHPSCEGGISDAAHLHLARIYDGRWLAAAGATPFVLGPWTATGGVMAYDGGLRRDDGAERTACACRLAGHNDLRR